MLVIDRMQVQGKFLFRWRSFLPLLLLPAALPAVGSGSDVEELLGQSAAGVWEAFSILVTLAGVALRSFTAGTVPNGTSGRNTRTQRAEALNTTGVYSTVRNPLYLGNFLVVLGFALATQNGWFVALTTLLFWLYYERIIVAEEAFLAERFGDDYTRWAESTPAFLPDLRLWHPSSLPFCVRTLIRREFNALTW